MISALLIKGAEKSLQYLDNDVKMLSSSFQAIGVCVETIEGNKFSVLPKLSEMIDGLGSTDTLIVYYTGHGIFKNGKITFELGTEQKAANYLPVDELISNISGAPTNSIVMIFDCCNAVAAEVAWKEYATDKHMLFLPSNRLESAEELEEYQASFFTYCIYRALESRTELLYEGNAITLDKLYAIVKGNAIQYNKEKSTNMPIPTLFGNIGKKIIIGHRNKIGKIEQYEEIVKNYMNDFVHCVEKCDRSCNESHDWCSTIFKSDANIYKYVIPSVREFISRYFADGVAKLDAFFANWFTIQDNYLGLLGDMGVGKTTACVYLFYYLAKKYEKGEYTYVPVYFSLSSLNSRLKNDSSRSIYAIIKSFMGEQFTDEIIKNLCKQNRMVFILDGFDEISSDSSIATILHNYEKLKPFMRFNCKTVLTCRTHYFSEQDQLEEVLMGRTQGTDFATALLNDEYPFNVVELQEFTEKEILELIKLLLPNDDNKKIWDTITEIYDLRDLAKRAILLKMIVQTLPELQKNNGTIDSATLYMYYTQKLLRREFESRKIGIELSVKEDFIGYIAYLMFVNEELTIATHKFDKEIMQYFKSSLYSRDELNNYNYDCKVSTFFSRDSQDNYRFMHKSFYEYYFALYCIRQMGEDNLEPWEKRWFPSEIARFAKEILSSKKYKHLISKIIQTSLDAIDDILIWNTLHILSLLDVECVDKYFTDQLKQEYLKRSYCEKRSVIIRQYCRVIAKFINRKDAENLIDRLIQIVKNNSLENNDNDETYYNYYGGKKAACDAFIKHLSVANPKYDAKLHLYLLEHIASEEYADKIAHITVSWNNYATYEDAILHAIEGINQRAKAM